MEYENKIKIITVKYKDPEVYWLDAQLSDEESLERDVKGAMDALAESYIKYGCEADFIFLDSATMNKIVMLRWSPFIKDQFLCDYAKESLEKRGINNIEIWGKHAGDSYSMTIDRLRDEFGRDIKIEYLDGINKAKNPLLYGIENLSKTKSEMKSIQEEYDIKGEKIGD